MKKMREQLIHWSKALAAVALVVATVTSNVTCICFTHQPDVPPAMDKYRYHK